MSSINTNISENSQRSHQLAAIADQSIPLLRKAHVAPETQLLLPYTCSEFAGALRHDKDEEW